MAGIEPPVLNRTARPPDSGLALASLVLGIISIPAASCLVGGLLGVIGIFSGVIHFSRHEHARPMAIVGTILSLIGVLLTAGALVVWLRFMPMIKERMESMEMGDHSAWIGVRAPELTLTSKHGEPIALGDLKGKRVLIDVFRYWDPDCQAQVKSLNALFDESDPERLVIIGITTDSGPGNDWNEEDLPTYKVATLDAMPAPYSETIWYPTTFYIDRNGVIDAVTSDDQTVEELRSLAGAPDYPGVPADSPGDTMRDLTPAEVQLQFTEIWSANIRDAQTMCAGDWNGDGTMVALVVDERPSLHIVDADGEEIGTVGLPKGFESVSHIEAGMNKQHGARLLGLSHWGNEVLVSDTAGKQAWQYAGSMGIDGAHWGDLDGDGSDEMVAGMNGFSGLHAVDSEGKSLWKFRRIGNVWSQAVVSADADRPARVFATEAGGQVYIFDGGGNKIRSVRPGGHYFTTLAAAAINAEGRVQVVALGDELQSNAARLVAFDERGFVAWTSDVRSGAKAMHEQAVASGDIDGDGERDWLFEDRDGNLVAATADGLRMGTIQPAREVKYFAILERSEVGATIVTLSFNEVTAFRAEPTVESSSTPAEVESAPE